MRYKNLNWCSTHHPLRSFAISFDYPIDIINFICKSFHFILIIINIITCVIIKIKPFLFAFSSVYTVRRTLWTCGHSKIVRYRKRSTFTAYNILLRFVFVSLCSLFFLLLLLLLLFCISFGMEFRIFAL